MTVYYYDLFTGTAGTPLTSHTADSGATWPNDADHYYGTGIVTLDGFGGVYQSNTGSSINLSSAAMPSTQNFEVLFSHIRNTSIAANAGLILLSSSWPTIADCYELFYAEGEGWLLYHTSISGSANTLLAGPYAGPAYGVTWYMKVDVSTSGGNTTFAVYYSITSTGPFAQLFFYTAATSTDLVAVGTWFYNPSTASTATTGQHIGALTVQDIPPLSAATLSGPTQQLYSTPPRFAVGLNAPAGTGGVVVTLSSSNSSDTFQATQGGTNLSPEQITIPQGQLSGTFWLTPGGATGNRTISIMTSPTLTYPGSPFTYDAVASGWVHIASGGIASTSDNENPLTVSFTGSPLIPAGSLIVCSVAANGGTMAAVSDNVNSLAYSYVGPGATGSACAEIFYTISRVESSAYSISAHIHSGYNGYLSMAIDAYQFSGNTGAWIGNNQDTTGTSISPASPSLSVSASDLIYAACATDVFSGTPGTITPGSGFTMRYSQEPIANICHGISVEDLVNYSSGIAPSFTLANSVYWQVNAVAFTMVTPSVTCSISNCYVTTSGQAVAFFFETGLTGSGTPICPTGMNFLPTFSVNGTSVGASTWNTWTTGYHPCAIVQFQPGVQVNPGDIVTVTTQAAWMSCTGNNYANAVTAFAVTNNFSQRSCFGTDTLVKTFRPGFNFSVGGTSDGTTYYIAKNWRYRCGKLSWNGVITGYSFLDLDWPNGFDSTGVPGITGYWAIGFDDTLYATNPATVTIASKSPSVCTVTQITGNNNTGDGNGNDQYYLFEVAYTPGTTSLNTPLDLIVHRGNLAQLNNLWIVAPGDFVVPAANDTTWSFDRYPSNPYVLSNSFLSKFPNGVGSCRWLDSTQTDGESNLTKPWEETQLDAISWHNSWTSTYTITYIEARPLVPPGTSGSTSYFYSDFLGSVGMGETWTCSSTLGANITSASQTTITLSSSSSVANDPLFCGVMIEIDSEQMMVQSVTIGSASIVVWRGACGTTATTHSSGAAITILSKRWAWTALTQMVVTGGQCVEFVTESPHGLPDQAVISFGNGWPTLNFLDGSTWNPSSSGTDNVYVFGAWITGPNTFAAICGKQSGSPTTLSTSSGTVAINTTWQPGQSNGYPVEFTAIVTGSFPGANVQVNIPITATDAYVWDVATKVVNYFPAGRRVYVELSDEPWNFWPMGACWVSGNLSSQAGAGWDPYYYVILRTGQIRTIFRSAFGDRANEIYAILNHQQGEPGGWSVSTPGNFSSPLSMAAYYDVPIDACAVANYISPDSSTSTVSAWNNSTTVQQLIDLYIHDTWYNPYGLTGQAASYGALIAGYNAYTGNNCVYYGYEGDVSGPPYGVNTWDGLMLDICNDPFWLIGQQDFYGFLQKWGYANSNSYSWNIYFYLPENWAYFHGIVQPYGKGDGSLASNGIAYTNRNYFVTPRFQIDYAGTPATNFIANTASVRGQALVEWMQPAQGKKRMLFVPYRFVNR